MPVDNTPTPRTRTLDPIEVAGKDSFPASDPPAVTPGPASPAKPPRPVDLDQPAPELVEVHEHPISNPATQSD
jgi:hypothetical protein